MSTKDDVIDAIARGNGIEITTLCTKCDRPFYCADPSETECGGCRGLGTIPSPPPFELELDAFERIEKAAAEWRNAYRALERGDAAGVCLHSSLAIAHTLQLSAGLR